MLDGLFRTAYFYFAELAEGSREPLLMPFISEMTGSAAVIVGFYLVIFPLARRFPLRGPRWLRRVPTHVLGLLVYSALKTLLMWGLRIVLWPMAGFGSYDYGVMRFRFPMEGANDILTYALLVGISGRWNRCTGDACTRTMASAEPWTREARAHPQTW